jgi:hypothetical protein
MPGKLYEPYSMPGIKLNCYKWQGFRIFVDEH